MSEKAKLIRGDPPKIGFKKKGEPPKNNNLLRKMDKNTIFTVNFNKFTEKLFTEKIN